jgi:hypothetical protein
MMMVMRVMMLMLLQLLLLQRFDQPLIYHLRHSIKVDEQTEKHLVRCRTVLVYPAEVAEDSDGGNILAMKGQDAGGLRAQIGSSIWRRNVAMEMLVLHVVCGGDLRQEAGDHLNDIGHWHGADLVLTAGILEAAG